MNCFVGLRFADRAVKNVTAMRSDNAPLIKLALERTPFVKD